MQMTMATQSLHASQPAASTRGKVLLAVWIVSLLVLNAVNLLFLRPRGSTFETKPALVGGRVLEAVPLRDGQVLAMTSDNRLVLFADGQVVREIQLDMTITALAAAPELERIYGGTGDRQVIVWDGQLRELSRFKVNGRVTGISPAKAGKIAVGYGIGRFTGRFYVGRFDERGNADFKKQVGLDINAVAAHDDTTYYANTGGKLGALSAAGDRLWEATLTQPALVIASTAGGQILTGDERGGVTLLNPDGKQAWYTSISEYKVRMVAYDQPSDKVMAGDDDGKVFLLRMSDGQPFYQTTASSTPIRGFAHASETDFYLLSEAGEWIRINLSLALGSGRQQAIDLLVLLGNVFLGAAAVATALLTYPRLRAPTLRTWEGFKESRTAYLLILPSMLMIVVFAYIPTAMGLYFSFTNFNLSEPLKFIGLRNFEKLIQDEFFWVGVGNMLLILVTSILKAVTVPLLVAELIFWLRWARLKYWLRVAFIIPSIVPGVVGILLWKQIYDPYIGLLNEVLKVLGLGQLARPWLSDPALAIWAIIFAGFPWVDIFAFLIYFGGLLNINKEIFDAAAIDGAGAWKRFRTIDLPMIRPQLRLILFFSFLGAVQGYGGIYVMTRGGPGTATYVPGLQMFLQISAAEYGYASAIGFVLALVILLVTVWRFRFNQTPDAA
jgi:ABC-type sugar transport system permease subunit